MREIKFRAWHKENERMSEDGSLEGWFLAASRADPCEIQREWHNSIFMQYTGLKDKNGKEIYEGDIVEPVPNAEVKYQVKWNEYVAGFHLVGVKHPSYILDLFVEPFERVVIGNIYENPELLEDKK